MTILHAAFCGVVMSPLFTPTTSVRVVGEEGEVNDLLIDLDGGFVIPPGGLDYDAGGGDAVDTLRGPDVATGFTITGAGVGSAGLVRFTGVESLMGGDGDFSFMPGGSFGGLLLGGGGNDSNRTLPPEAGQARPRTGSI